MVPWRNSVPRKRSALAPLSFIDPCLPTLAERAPAADGWVHEIKHRFAIRGSSRTSRGSTCGTPSSMPKCCCDGEGGITDFDRLMARVYDASAYAYAFDLSDAGRRRHAPPAARQAALQIRCLLPGACSKGGDRDDSLAVPKQHHGVNQHRRSPGCSPFNPPADSNVPKFLVNGR
jgi:hypothetical protein